MTEDTQRLVESSAIPEPAPAIGGGDLTADGLCLRPGTASQFNGAGSEPPVVNGSGGRPQNDNGPQENGAAAWSADRRRARRAALQVLYEVDCTSHSPGATLKYRQAEERFSSETLTFLIWLVRGVLSYQADLDQLIGRYAPEWPVQQLAIVDRNVLRLSIFELTSPDADAPPKVVINEAVELAKTFGSDSSPRFVNGVLGTALREISQSSDIL